MMDIILDAGYGSIKSVAGIGMIVVPLMIVMQVLKDCRVLDKIADILRPMTEFFGMSKEASFPLIVGLVFGLSYGAGVIVQSSKEGNLTKKDVVLMVLFLINCHAVFEDTLIFVAVGANGWVLLLARTAAAVALTYFMSKRIRNLDENKLMEAASGNGCGHHHG
ncbi:Nucleoside recognition [Peptoclostridium litorale DSM 5388]|uniref:Nucleoside recognition domain-containing protein n=1 Tax=Peptoclostridium litorale DSM 5388 TaxID=1121324 RepID=A0A069RIL9_PEPLI|nr:nucleoside recognition domain-containing protein [Peptoclostridium litorale]KDR96005.1 nucleoside recognition domain-containing protein [Peptoclostridium litorale DSM 5388]SIO06820.1 Nucleoside recognition [Peptoclostridium litorale DSM 5388]